MLRSHQPLPLGRIGVLALLLAWGLTPDAIAQNWRSTLTQAEEKWELGERAAARKQMVEALRQAEDQDASLGIGHCSLQLGMLIGQDGEEMESCAAFLQSQQAFSRALDRDRIQESWTGSPPSWLRAAVTSTPRDWSAFEASLSRARECLSASGNSQEARASRELADRLKAFRLGLESPESGTASSWLSGPQAGDLGTRQLPEGVIRVLKLPGRPTCMAFSPDGKTLAIGVGGTSSWLRVHDVATGALLASLPFPGDAVQTMVFRAGGEELLIALSRRLQRLEPKDFQPLPTPDRPDPLLTHRTVSKLVYMSASAEDRRLIASSFTPVGEPADLASWRSLDRPAAIHQEKHFDTIVDMAVSPDGRALALVGAESYTMVLDRDLEFASLLDPVPEGEEEVEAIRLAYDAAGRLAVAYRGGRIRLWDPREEDEPLLVFPDKTSGPPQDMLFGRRRARLYTAHLDGTLAIWNAHTGTCEKQVPAHGGDLWRLALSPDGALLATAGGDGRVLLWSIEP